MSVPLSYHGALMSESFSDLNRSVSEMDKECAAGVSEIVYSDSLNACLLASPVHLVMEIVFRYREDTAIIIKAVY